MPRRVWRRTISPGRRAARSRPMSVAVRGTAHFRGRAGACEGIAGSERADDRRAAAVPPGGARPMKHYSAYAVAREAMRYHKGWERAWGNPEPKSHYDTIIVGGGGH